MRVFVVGGRVIGAIERTAPAGEWRTNVSRRRFGAARSTLPPEWSRPRAARDRGGRRRLRRRRSAAVARRLASSCSRSTAFRDGRGCSRPPASTWRAPSSSTCRARACSAGPQPRGRRSLSRHERCADATCRSASGASTGIAGDECRPRRRSSPVCSRSAHRSRATSRRPPLRGPALRRLPRQRRRDWRAAGRRRHAAVGATIRSRDRSHGALDAVEHQSGHRAAARAAGARGVAHGGSVHDDAPTPSV